MICSVHAEVAAAVGDELVELFERAGIEQQLDPLARGQLAGGVLALEPIGAAAELGASLEIGEDVFWLHRAWSTATSALRDRLDLFPVLQELLEADVGERMVEQLIDDRRRTGADVGAHARRLDDVDRDAGSWRRALRS